jgi:hypothetical protein
VKQSFVAPEFKLEAFNCPVCNAYAHQLWRNLYYNCTNGAQRWEEKNPKIRTSTCLKCKNEAIWISEIMMYPDHSGIEPPNEDLDDAIKDDYLEAASILQKSPRGAAALLRLAVQKLCKQLGESGKKISDDIASLVKKGLPEEVQQSLDVIRVIGNEAVHPGELDLKDDIETARQLFDLVNFIAEEMITRRTKRDELFNKLPQDKKDAIKKRYAPPKNQE